MKPLAQILEIKHFLKIISYIQGKLIQIYVYQIKIFIKIQTV